MNTLFSASQLEAAYQSSRTQLLAQRNERGHWEGELSTSALSTATAVMAFHQAVRHRSSAIEGHSIEAMISNGVSWLRNHRNDDGGWGDTVKSISNISTTMLVRAVLEITRNQYGEITQLTEADLAPTDAYIKRIGGVKAVKKRYGKDRTFSVPILMQCALAGQVEWKQVSQLPFELSCLPADWYKWAQLPVVSYALPALIAIGLLKHRKRPTWFLPWRWLRSFSAPSALKVLTRIQPTSGGFLEAAPLTSFVTMSLIEAGEVEHPVVHKAIDFLTATVRSDGSWPIDTNLATWVTTLSINALGRDLPQEAVEPLTDWLLNQQYREVHPYTNADPGGWAWTDLSGGVPDADDTPGAMLALSRLSTRVDQERQERIQDALQFASKWLLSLQNRDGGWPTFCRGWGKLPFDRSSPDITAHALRALVGIQQAPSMKMVKATSLGREFLKKQQRADGAWLPLWFGNQFATDDENATYGTSRVLLAFAHFTNPAAGHTKAYSLQIESITEKAINYLLSIQNADGGWGGSKGVESSVEETALAIEALLEHRAERTAIERGVHWLIKATEQDRIAIPTPIGFYFAKLWYFEKLYPLIFATSALRKAKAWYDNQTES